MAPSTNAKNTRNGKGTKAAEVPFVLEAVNHPSTDDMVTVEDVPISPLDGTIEETVAETTERLKHLATNSEKRPVIEEVTAKSAERLPNFVTNPERRPLMQPRRCPSFIPFRRMADGKDKQIMKRQSISKYKLSRLLDKLGSLIDDSGDDNDLSCNNNDSDDEIDKDEFMSEKQAVLLLNDILKQTAPAKYKQRLAQPAVRAVAVDNFFALITREQATKPPAMAESTQCFIDRIANYPLPRNLAIPAIGVYDGTTDPEDFLTMFEGVMRLQHWEDETACHMFPMVLQKMAREWFASLSPRSITSFLDLRAKFVMQYQNLRSCTLTHLDAHEITMHHNESLSNFMKRYTLEAQKIPDCPESQLVSGFIFCLDQRRFSALVHALRYDLPKTLHQALEVAQRHVRAGERGLNKFDTGSSSKSHNGGRYFDRNQRRNDNSNGGWRGNNHPNDFHYNRKPIERHPLIMALTKTPKEILFTEPIRTTFNAPAPMEEREGPKSELWCDFHEAWGHDTDNCKSLMREIIAKIKAGELNHLLPGKQYRRNDPHRTKLYILCMKAK